MNLQTKDEHMFLSTNRDDIFDVFYSAAQHAQVLSMWDSFALIELLFTSPSYNLICSAVLGNEKTQM